MTLFAYDQEIRAQKGATHLCGVDEAGRGPLAGPVYAAAVILPCGPALEGLNDSKKLTEKKREPLFDQIRDQAVAWCIAQATVEEIEALNILGATLLAMKRAVEGLSTPPDLALIDGDKLPGIEIPALAVSGGDRTSACIAAASILAKVARDQHMLALAEQHPQYCFERHKGYGTKLHYQMLDTHGPCAAHRMSFLKGWMKGGKNGR